MHATIFDIVELSLILKCLPLVIDNWGYYFSIHPTIGMCMHDYKLSIDSFYFQQRNICQNK